MTQQPGRGLIIEPTVGAQKPRPCSTRPASVDEHSRGRVGGPRPELGACVRRGASTPLATDLRVTKTGHVGSQLLAEIVLQPAGHFGEVAGYGLPFPLFQSRDMGHTNASMPGSRRSHASREGSDFSS